MVLDCAIFSHPTNCCVLWACLVGSQMSMRRQPNVHIADTMSRCFLLVSLCCLALSGKQIWRVRNKVKAAKVEWMLGSARRGVDIEGATMAMPRDRRFSTLRAFLTPAATQDSVLPVNSNCERGWQRRPSVPGAKLSTSLAPIECRDNSLDTENQFPPTTDMSRRNTRPASPQLSPLSEQSQTWHEPTPIGSLDRATSDRSVLQHVPTTAQLSTRRSSRFDRLHWKYAKFAILCTLVLFITWVRMTFLFRPHESKLNNDIRFRSLLHESTISSPPRSRSMGCISHPRRVFRCMDLGILSSTSPSTGMSALNSSAVKAGSPAGEALW
jgi:hypothetical protein